MGHLVFPRLDATSAKPARAAGAHAELCCGRDFEWNGTGRNHGPRRVAESFPEAVRRIATIGLDDRQGLAIAGPDPKVPNRKFTLLKSGECRNITEFV